MVGDILRDIRLSRRMTQSEVCNGICSRSMLSHIEHGDCKPSLELLTKLCRRLDIKLSDVFVNDQNHNTPDVVTYLEDLIVYGEFLEAIQYSKKILRQKHIQEDAYLKCQCTRLMGLAYTNLGQYDHALRLYEQAVGVAQEGSSELRIKCLNGLAAVMINIGKTKEALQVLLDTFDFASIVDYPQQHKIRLIYNIAKAYRTLGDQEQSMIYIQKGLHLSRKSGTLECAGHLEVLKGLIQLGRNQHEEAKQSFEKALHLYVYIDDNQSQVGCLINLSETYLMMQDYSNALRIIKQAHHVMRKSGSENLRVLVRETLLKVKMTVKTNDSNH